MLLHMNGSGNQTPDLLILSVTPFPYMLLDYLIFVSNTNTTNEISDDTTFQYFDLGISPNGCCQMNSQFHDHNLKAQ